MPLNCRPLLLALQLCLTLALPAAALHIAMTHSAAAQDASRQFLKALNNAKPGTVLTLAPGNYGAPEIKPSPARPEGSAPVTIRSADPANPAIFTGLALKGASGIIFDQVMFDYRFSRSDRKFNDMGLNWPIQILGARDITVRNSVFDGDLATVGRPEDIGYATASGLVVRHSRGITVENNEFRRFQRALGIDNSRDVRVTGNNIHSIRMDGMNFAAMQSLLIEGNHIHSFQRSLTSNDHPDMIQFWTAGTTSPNRDITIRGNLLNSGTGGWTQSIFMRNEVVDQGLAGRKMFYRNVLIEENVIINAHLHGITLGETDGLKIRRNTIVHNRLSDGPGPGQKGGGDAQLWTPRITVSPKSDGVEITGNITSFIAGKRKRPDWTVSGNLFVQDRDPAKPGWYDDVFVAARHGDPTVLSSFTYLPGGPADTGRVGARALHKRAIAATGRRALRTGPRRARPAAMSRAPARSDTDDVQDMARSPQSTPLPVTTDIAAPDSDPMDIPVAMIRVARDPRYVNRFSFDAGLSLLGDAPQATYRWDFTPQSGQTAATDTTATGPQIQRDFTTPGRHRVTLTLSTPDGQNTRAAVLVDVPFPEVVRFDPGRGQLLVRRGADMAALRKTPVSDTVSGSGPVLFLRATQQPPFQIPVSALGGLFGARDFDIRLRLRTVGSPEAAGEVLNLHTALSLAVTRGGRAEFRFHPGGQGTPVILRTAPLRLNDGAWHDLRVSYDGALMVLWVNGEVGAQRRLAGPVGPARSWGLSFGNPFGQNSAEVDIADFRITTNTARFAL